MKKEISEFLLTEYTPLSQNEGVQKLTKSGNRSLMTGRPGFGKRSLLKVPYQV